MFRRTIIIGDVHGMLAELDQLMDELEYSQDDRLISCGDLVDKGPDSLGVIDRFCQWQDSGHEVHLVRGNHEDKWMRRINSAHKKVAAISTGSGPRCPRDVDPSIQGISLRGVSLLESSQLWFEIPEFNALVVHGGIPPLLERLPSVEELAAMTRKERRFYEQVCRVRFVRGQERTTLKLTVELGAADDPRSRAVTDDQIALDGLEGKVLGRKKFSQGEFLALGDQTEDDPYWASQYDGRFGHVFFGHEPYLQESPCSFPHATGIDTGAVFGGWLTAVVLVPDETPSFLSVKAEKSYASMATAFEE